MDNNQLAEEMIEETLEEETVLSATADDAPEEENVVNAIADETPEEENVQESYMAPDYSQIPPQPSQIPSEPAKNGNKAVVVVVTLLFMALIGLCVYIAVSLSKVIPADGDSLDKEYEAETSNPWEEILGDDFKKDTDDTEETPEQDADESTEDDFKWEQDPQQEEKPDSYTGDETYSVIPDYVWDDRTWQQSYQNHTKETFGGPYYEDVVDCIDKSVSYTVKREFDEYADREEGVCVRLSYIQLEGDIPNLESINEMLKDSAYIYMKNMDSVKETVGEGHAGIYADTRSYVTYNTENQISIVLRDEIMFSYLYSDVSLKGININLDTGTVLDNTEILALDDNFGREFRDRSNAQNGISEGGIEPYSDEEILAMLRDPGSVIIFYTPIGLELGYHYRGDYYSGWVTISMKDYAKYLPSL
nr:hypothetical protein [Lachnospiraceae bacterium]